jgi:deoxycytidylate deaminase
MQGQEAPADESRASSGSYMSVSQPWPLPPFTFDPSLSEDENFITYSLVLARFSVSRKGHMGALLVRSSLDHAPDQVLPGDIAKVRFADEAIRQRVITYANNTPLLCHDKPKVVPEIHAEALCISRAASLGKPTAGSTIYVTFPPCNECFKLIVAAGIRRCVFRKVIRYPAGEAVLGQH